MGTVIKSDRRCIERLMCSLFVESYMCKIVMNIFSPRILSATVRFGVVTR